MATVHRDELVRFTDILNLRHYERGQVVTEPGEPTTEVLFPIEGVFSVVAECAGSELRL